MDRIRGQAGDLSPRWRPSRGDIGKRKDLWVPRLLIAAAASVVIATGLFVYYSVSLHSGTADMRTETARLEAGSGKR
jgi:hypothetical protein